ncbi:MAG: polysaccharide deacetylase family protein [Acidobacteria bacterium]|nr:polysaccharide deacetylase family protein [Acidobacteriota bacterium]
METETSRVGHVFGARIICLAAVALAFLNSSARTGANTEGAQAQGASSLTPRKLIALTFDDGPRPYVLVGRKSEEGGPAPGLLDLLDREKVKATFFVLGFRLADAANDYCRKIDVGINCREAVEEEHRRGHEIENHTYGHGPFSRMKERYGEEWTLNDIDRASRIIQSVTGERPRYVRPPDWDIWPELRERIEARGYSVMMKSIGKTKEPPAREDVDTQDYIFTNLPESKLPIETLRKYVLERLEQRERKGVYTHILVFHELPLSTTALGTLIPELKQHGYQFLLLRDYMKVVAPAPK